MDEDGLEPLEKLKWKLNVKIKVVEN